ncbi:hypothetical protein GCM10027021_15620 [Dyella kyungheensis]
MSLEADATMPLSEDDVFLLLGRAVYEAQETEANIHVCISIALGLTMAQSIEHLQQIYAKKTLGQFFTIVRERIGVSESFDDFLRDYIGRRNFIVHNLSRTSTFSPYSEGGRAKCLHFLSHFCQMNRKVSLTFMALTEAWMHALDSRHSSDERFKGFRETDLFREIVKDFMPQLPSLFGKGTAEV